MSMKTKTAACLMLFSWGLTLQANAADHEAIGGNEAQATYAFYGSNLITVAGGDASFADRVVSATAALPVGGVGPDAALGPADCRARFCLEAYSLGCGGELVLAFDDLPITEGPGVDLVFAEVGEAKESAELSVSTDGGQWIVLGRTTGGVEQLDISGLVAADTEYRFLKIRDLGGQCYGPSQGVDIDAVAAVFHPPPPPPPPQDSPQSSPEQVRHEEAVAERIVLSGEVLFDFGKSELREEGIKALAELAAKISSGNYRVTVEGHADGIGADEPNDRISLARAKSVAAFLVEHGGLNADSVRAEGFGKKRPRSDNSTSEGRAANRRVEVVMTPLTN